MRDVGIHLFVLIGSLVKSTQKLIMGTFHPFSPRNTKQSKLDEMKTKCHSVQKPFQGLEMMPNKVSVSIIYPSPIPAFIFELLTNHLKTEILLTSRNVSRCIIFSQKLRAALLVTGYSISHLQLPLFFVIDTDLFPCNSFYQTDRHLRWNL